MFCYLYTPPLIYPPCRIGYLLTKSSSTPTGWQCVGGSQPLRAHNESEIKSGVGFIPRSAKKRKF